MPTEKDNDAMQQFEYAITPPQSLPVQTKWPAAVENGRTAVHNANPPSMPFLYKHVAGESVESSAHRARLSWDYFLQKDRNRNQGANR
jgi:hypothetical protein